MRDLPIVFPISLAVVIIMVFFSGAYAISAGAVNDQPEPTSSAIGGTVREGEQVVDNAWFEDAAVFVCPFH